MRHDEEDMQTACVRWFNLQYPRYAPLLHHSPNGGRRSIREAARFKAMGTRAGFPDLVLLVPRLGCGALFLELKTPKGAQSASQKRYQALLEANGYKYIIIRKFEQFQKVISTYMG